MKALDLFCGAGGAGLGLERAGFEVLGLDNWNPAIQTHRKNGLDVLPRDLIAGPLAFGKRGATRGAPDDPVYPSRYVGGDRVGSPAGAYGCTERAFDDVPEDEEDSEQQQRSTVHQIRTVYNDLNTAAYISCYFTQGHMNLDLPG